MKSVCGEFLGLGMPLGNPAHLVQIDNRMGEYYNEAVWQRRDYQEKPKRRGKEMTSGNGRVLSALGVTSKLWPHQDQKYLQLI